MLRGRIMQTKYREHERAMNIPCVPVVIAAWTVSRQLKNADRLLAMFLIALDYLHFPEPVHVFQRAARIRDQIQQF
jgi:hypothetical protein